MQTSILFLLILTIGFQSIINAQAVITKAGTRNDITTASFQRTYNIKQLTGKWQETKRTNITSRKKVSFLDTLQLNFNKRDSVIVRDGISMSQKGYAAIDRTNKLQVAGDAYTIVSLSRNTLVINDGEHIRQLQKKKLFYYETLGNIIIPKEDLSEPVIANVKKVLGNWDVYRTQATPGVAEDSAIIKQMVFSNINEDGSVWGEVTFTKDAITESIPFRSVFEKGTLKVNTAKHIWNMYTYKADGKELVFGQQGGLVYFAKQL